MSHTKRMLVAVAAALVGFAATTIPTPNADARRAKPNIKCRTDRFGVFQTNRGRGVEPIGASYVPSIDRLEIAGGSAKVRGRGLRTSVTARAFSMTAAIPDLEGMPTLPFATKATSISMTEVATRGLSEPTVRIWGANEGAVGFDVDVTATKLRRGMLTLTFSGSVPVQEGDTLPLDITGGKAVVKLVLE